MPLGLKGRAGKLAFAVSSIGGTGSNQLLSASLVFFLTTAVGLNAWLAGLIWSFTGIWGVISNIVIGSLSDKTRTRWGRRIPYILLGIPIMLLFSILTWSPPLGGKPLADPYSLQIFLYASIVLAVYRFGVVMVILPIDAVFPEMWTDQKDRSEVTVYRESFAVVGGIIAMVVFPLMKESFKKQFGELGSWAWGGGITAAIFAGMFLFSLLGMRERKEFSVVDKPLPFIASFKAALTNRSWITYRGAELMTSCMIDWISVMAFFFVTISLGMEEGALSIMMGVELAATFAFFLIWRRICLRHGTKVTLAASMIAFCAGTLPAMLWGNGIVGACIMGVMAGITLGGLVLARALMWADVMDEDEIKTGVRREGMYSGVAAPIGQIDPIVVGTGSAFLLTSIGFVSGVAAKDQPLSVGPGIRVGMVVFPAIFTAIMLIFLKFYPLGKKRVEEVGKEIEKMHAEKAKKLEEMKT